MLTKIINVSKKRSLLVLGCDWLYGLTHLGLLTGIVFSDSLMFEGLVGSKNIRKTLEKELPKTEGSTGFSRVLPRKTIKRWFSTAFLFGKPPNPVSFSASLNLRTRSCRFDLTEGFFRLLGPVEFFSLRFLFLRLFGVCSLVFRFSFCISCFFS